MAVSRFAAEQGVTVRLRVHMKRNGNLFDPFSFDRVEVRQRTGAATTVLVDTIAASEIVQEAQGIFYVDWPIPIGQEVGTYVDRWFFTVDSGDPVTSDDATFVILAAGAFSGAPGYITPDEVRDRYLSGTLLSDAEIQVLIDEATAIVNKYCGQKFGAQSLTLDLNGTGECWIVAPYHVLSLSSITVSSGCGGGISAPDVDDFTLQGRWIIHRGYLPWPHGGVADNCGVCSFGCCDIFSRGQKNVRIVGTFGLYEDVPAPIKRAVGLLVMYGGEDDTRTTAMAFNYDSESKEQHSYGRHPTDSLISIKLRGGTGIPEVDHILNLYRQRAGRMTVI